MTYTLVKVDNLMEIGSTKNWLIYCLLAIAVFYLLFHKVLKKDIVKTGVIEENTNRSVKKLTGSLLF